MSVSFGVDSLRKAVEWSGCQWRTCTREAKRRKRYLSISGVINLSLCRLFQAFRLWERRQYGGWGKQINKKRNKQTNKHKDGKGWGWFELPKTEILERREALKTWILACEQLCLASPLCVTKDTIYSFRKVER